METALRTYGSLCSFDRNEAVTVDSIVSANKLSILTPIEYREVLGKVFKHSCQSLYTPINPATTGKTPAGGGLNCSSSRIQFIHTYNDIISIENLLAAWKEFVKGKRKKKDVQEFSLRLADNIFALHQDLKDKTYRHSGYNHFKINDPKPRDIHKAVVRDRLLHHAVYRKLFPFFDRTFIADSFSCRLWKGTHRAINKFRMFARKASFNHTKTVWVLKCDIRKFFASIDQKILIEILKTRIPDVNIIWLISEIIGSFHATEPGIGLPLGNLTSQLLVNIYMNEFDQFVKHKLKARCYIRYTDDFVILSKYRQWLKDILICIRAFLSDALHLSLHPNKISIQTFASGIDYLGWVHFLDHRVLRINTKKRMISRISQTKGKRETVQSYLGLISHGNTKKLQRQVNLFTVSMLKIKKLD